MKKKLLLLVPAITLFLAQPMTVFAVTEAEMEALGKDAVAGNIFIWFLCAIAFLKISQKIDSFMSSLGINVGHTGGSMMAEMMIAARGITSVKSVTGGSFLYGRWVCRCSRAALWPECHEYHDRTGEQSHQPYGI